MGPQGARLDKRGLKIGGGGFTLCGEERRSLTFSPAAAHITFVDRALFFFFAVYLSEWARYTELQSQMYNVYKTFEEIPSK